MQHPALGLGDGEPAVRDPVGVEGQAQPPLLGGLAFGGLEASCGRSLRRPGVRSGSGCVRRGGPGRRGRSRLRSRPAPPQPGRGARCRGRRGGPPTHRDDAGLVGVHRTGGEGAADPVPPRLERGGEAYLPGDHVAGGCGWRWRPRPRSRCTRSRSRPGPARRGRGRRTSVGREPGLRGQRARRSSPASLPHPARTTGRSARAVTPADSVRTPVGTGCRVVVSSSVAMDQFKQSPPTVLSCFHRSGVVLHNRESHIRSKIR